MRSQRHIRAEICYCESRLAQDGLISKTERFYKTVKTILEWAENKTEKNIHRRLISLRQEIVKYQSSKKSAVTPPNEDVQEKILFAQGTALLWLLNHRVHGLSS